jgi:hypothetical protein
MLNGRSIVKPSLKRQIALEYFFEGDFTSDDPNAYNGLERIRRKFAIRGAHHLNSTDDAASIYSNKSTFFKDLQKLNHLADKVVLAQEALTIKK